MEKIVSIEGKKIGFRCSAGTVRRYRSQFGRDLILDMSELEGALVKERMLNKEQQEIAENVLWIMAKEHDDSIPPIDDWLSDFSQFFVLGAVSHVLIMWRENLKTLSKSKKR